MIYNGMQGERLRFLDSESAGLASVRAQLLELVATMCDSFACFSADSTSLARKPNLYGNTVYCGNFFRHMSAAAAPAVDVNLSNLSI